MVKGFNPGMSFGAGFIGAINKDNQIAKAMQIKIDDEYRQTALKVNEESEIYAAKKKIDQQGNEDFNNALSAKLQSNKQNTTNQATYDSLKSAQTNPQVAQDTSITGEATPPPTNTPDTTGTGTVQPNVQTPQVDMQPVNQIQQVPGGLNSPQGGPVPLKPLQAGDTSNPLAPPNQQSTSPVDNSTGTTYPSTNKDIVSSWKGTPLTREDATIIQAYANEANRDGKGYYANNPDGAIDVGFAKWKEEQAKLKKTDSAWTGSQEEIQKANTLGVPYVQDKQFQSLDSKTQYTIKENDTKRLFGSQDEQRDIAKIPVLSNDLKTLYQLNKAISTGDLKALPGGVSLAAATDSYNALFDKITNVIAILSRAPGLGRMSVAELTADQKGFASLKVPNAANNSIILTKLAIAQRKSEQVDFQKAVISATGHYDDGIYDNIWKKYDESNPVLDLSNPLSPKVLPYTKREDFMQGNDNSKTSLLANTGNITHNISEPSKEEPKKAVTFDKSGNPQFDFSGF